MHSITTVLSLLCSVYTLLISAQTACNGHPELCGRQYSNITSIGTHDSAFVGLLPTDNQDVSVTDQLNAGIRFLQAQTHKNLFGNTLELCHTSCLERDAGTLSAYLCTVKTWLDANPNEVVTILLVNGDNVDVSMVDDAYTSSGLKSYAYTPSTSPLGLSAWPTLQEMISAGTRLVAFLDAGVNPSVPYILDEFTYFFETPYDTTDPTFPQCTIDRPHGLTTADGRMYIVNHFLDLGLGDIDIPDDAADNTTNAATGVGSIGAQADICIGLYERAPWGVLVDYFDKGDVFTAQNALNGLS